jgi:hypothetical protein
MSCVYDYLINQGKIKLYGKHRQFKNVRLQLLFFENETSGALHKAWKGYVIAKNKDEYDKTLHYAGIIRVPT